MRKKNKDEKRLSVKSETVRHLYQIPGELLVQVAGGTGEFQPRRTATCR